MSRIDNRPALAPREALPDEESQVYFTRLRKPVSSPEQGSTTKETGTGSLRLGLESFPAPFGMSPQAQQRWLLALLIVGLVLRLTRYLLRFPLWEDEAMLSVNFIDQTYAGLLQPLHYCQVAPVLFLWGQLTFTKLLGFNEYSLRLVPFLCGLGSLFLYRHVAGKLLQGTPLVLAVGLFAVAYPMTRYAAEAKPYGCDLLIALAILALTIRWLERPEQTRWLWYLAALIGPAVGYSFPAVFIGGGTSLVIAWSLWSARSHRALSGGSDLQRAEPNEYRRWLAWMVFNAVLLAGVVAILTVSRHAVDAATQQNMEEGWTDAFPPIAQPWRLPLWLLEIHAGGMLGYPLGGPHFGSSFSLLCFIIGVCLFVRRRHWLPLALLLAPLGLNFLAAAVHRFPYGGHARMTLFLAPAFCTLIAVGLMAALQWMETRRMVFGAGNWGARWGITGRVPVKRGTRSMPQSLRIALVLLVLMAAGSWLRDMMQPYKSGTTLRAREFAQWFWFELPQMSEVASCETDMGMGPVSSRVNCGWSSLYFCNQRIYSPRHARGEKPDLAHVSAERPLRCVLYRSPQEERQSPPADPLARPRWLEKMQADYALAGYDTYPFAAYDKSDRRRIGDDYLEVFTFVPRPDGVAARDTTMLR